MNKTVSLKGLGVYLGENHVLHRFRSQYSFEADARAFAVGAAKERFVLPDSVCQRVK